MSCVFSSAFKTKINYMVERFRVRKKTAMTTGIMTKKTRGRDVKKPKRFNRQFRLHITIISTILPVALQHDFKLKIAPTTTNLILCFRWDARFLWSLERSVQTNRVWQTGFVTSSTPAKWTGNVFWVYHVSKLHPVFVKIFDRFNL